MLSSQIKNNENTNEIHSLANGMSVSSQKEEKDNYFIEPITFTGKVTLGGSLDNISYSSDESSDELPDELPNDLSDDSSGTSQSSCNIVTGSTLKFSSDGEIISSSRICNYSLPNVGIGLSSETYCSDMLKLNDNYSLPNVGIDLSSETYCSDMLKLNDNYVHITIFIGDKATIYTDENFDKKIKINSKKIGPKITAKLKAGQKLLVEATSQTTIKSIFITPPTKKASQNDLISQEDFENYLNSSTDSQKNIANEFTSPEQNDFSNTINPYIEQEKGKIDMLGINDIIISSKL